MKAVQFIEAGSLLELTECEVPTAAPGCLVFKVNACGICASDLHAAETSGMVERGSVLGHEYAGEVVGIGAGVSGWQEGDRMIAFPGRPCGACSACRKGNVIECEDFVMQGFDLRMPGAYAEYSTSVAAMSMKIPDSISDADAAIIEPLAVGLNAWKFAQVEPGSNILILGAGIIGLAIAKWASFFGAATVGMSEMVAARIERANKTSVDFVIDATECQDAVAEYQRLSGNTPTVIFECIGRPMLDKIIGMAPNGAHLVMVGTGMQAKNFTVLSAAMKRLRMTFPMAYEAEDFGFVMQMLASGRIKVEPLISGTVSLDDLPTMFELLGKPNDHCKVLIKP